MREFLGVVVVAGDRVLVEVDEVFELHDWRILRCDRVGLILVRVRINQPQEYLRVGNVGRSEDEVRWPVAVLKNRHGLVVERGATVLA